QPQVWEIEVADYEWWPKGDPDSPDTDYELEPVPPAERQEGPRFVSSARRISLLGYDWFVGNFFWGNLTIEDIRRDLYLIVAEALKNGDLSRLRHCPCRKFFIAHDLRQNFCSVDCRTKFNNQRRLASTYFLELRRKKREIALRKALRL